jgi:hypothetical protein
MCVCGFGDRVEAVGIPECMAVNDLHCRQIMVLRGVRGLGIGEAAVGFGWMYACFTPGVAYGRESSWLLMDGKGCGCVVG